MESPARQQDDLSMPLLRASAATTGLFSRRGCKEPLFASAKTKGGIYSRGVYMGPGVRRAMRQSMARTMQVREWVTLIREAGATPQLDSLIGVSVTLAARLLGVSRSRVHQLLKTRKLAAVDVFDEQRTRIGHMVTLASIARRRRTVRPRRTQWRSFSVM